MRARRAGENTLSERRQVSSQIEGAAFPGGDKLKHAGHELEDGTKGLPHYQAKGEYGHSFWGKIGGAALAVSGVLDNIADAAEYIPDATPRPATEEDVNRTNGIITFINKSAGTNIPKFSGSWINDFKGVFRVDGRVDEARLDKQLEEKR